jgi:hypothetical protein
MMVLSWLGIQPKIGEQAEDVGAREGTAIMAEGLIHTPLALKAGEMLALEGSNNHAKHYFCDGLLGFVKVKGATVAPENLNSTAAVFGRSPLLYGDTIQESLLYRTQGVRKQELYDLIGRLFGPSLRARTTPLNPLFGNDGEPVATQSLTAREHLEVAQINVILQKAPLVIIDLSSELMREALEEGFRPAAELLARTLIVILPPNRSAAWAELVLGRPADGCLQFE